MFDFNFGEIKAVFFDADNTLYKVVPTYGHVYRDVLKKHGIAVNPDSINRKIGKIWTGFASDYLNISQNGQTNKEREDQLWQEFFSRVLNGINVSFRSEDLYSDIYKAFSDVKYRKITNHLIECLENLKIQGKVLGVLSNYDLRVHSLLKELGLNKYFEYTFSCIDVGFKKPSKRAFEVVSDSIGISGEKIIYVGDNLELDYIASRNAGWKSILYSPLLQRKNVYSIASFLELRD